MTKHLPYDGTDGLYDGYDFDVTVVEEWDDAPTGNIDPPRKRTTTAVQSPIEIAMLCEVCKVL